MADDGSVRQSRACSEMGRPFGKLSKLRDVMGTSMRDRADAGVPQLHELDITKFFSTTQAVPKRFKNRDFNIFNISNNMKKVSSFDESSNTIHKVKLKNLIMTHMFKNIKLRVDVRYIRSIVQFRKELRRLFKDATHSNTQHNLGILYDAIPYNIWSKKKFQDARECMDHHNDDQVNLYDVNAIFKSDVTKLNYYLQAKHGKINDDLHMASER